MSHNSLASALPVGDRLLLDSSILIAYLNGDEAISGIAETILDEFVRSGRNVAYFSMVTAMEVMIRPLRRGPGAFQTVLNFLTYFPNLSGLAVDIGVAQEAANLRVFHQFKPADALVIATGIMAGVSHLITNDERWQRLEAFPHQRIRVCSLAQHLPFP